VKQNCKQKGTFGNMWRKSSASSHKRTNSHASRGSGPPLVGTQAKALKHLEKNRSAFHYPEDSRFVSPIEHALLYSMIDEGPAVYPEEVVLIHINEEDFTIYLPVTTPSSNSIRERIEDETSQKISYAQLSAILALSAENFPPTKEVKESISQVLCKRVLSCVIKYAEENDLDRQAEIQELLEPVQAYTLNRSAKAELRGALPFYLGYAATLITANPIPMLVGFSVMSSGNEKIEKEKENMRSITKETNRRADVEKTSLLDEQGF
jgi:hypothetical protein